MLVPEIVFVAVVDPTHAEMMSTPGPKMSTTGPKLEKDALLSLRSVAPTVQTAGAEAGEALRASMPSLPAATATKTPALTAALRYRQLVAMTNVIEPCSLR